MNDLRTIIVIIFYRKTDEWPICSEKFLSKAKRYGFKDLILGKLSISKIDEIFDDVSEEGQKMLRNSGLNEIDYMELILSLILRLVMVKLPLIWLKDKKEEFS
jgi:hypothetical protein